MREQGDFRRGRGRRLWFWGASLLAVVAFCAVFVASSGASLSDSPFEGSDGNMIVDTAGHTDWCTDFPAPASGTACTTPIPGLRTLIDVASGTSDNSFTGGSHEDDPNVTIATGSVPPNKNDLTRAYIASEKISGQTFLYLAWERQPNPNGSANIDFELDQNATPGDFTQPGDLTINRTEGDILITYDFGGSGTPDLGLLTWLTSGNGHSDSDCEASGQTLPCWGNRIDLNPASTPPAEAGVNSSTIDEVFAGGQLDAGSFGEAKIDLSEVPGVFQPDTCKAFGNMFVKSRSSGSSIDAELKDFIAPEPIQVSNCPTPDIATQTSVDSMTIGDTQSVGDSATLTNGDNPTGDVSFQLYSDSNCQTPVAGVSGTATLDQSGVADFSGADFTPDHTGTYYWGVSYPGDNHNNPASACGGDNEEIVVNPASPGVTTVADPSSVVVESTASKSVSDTATFTNGFQLDGRDATFTLYNDASCDPDNATSVTGTATISDGSATFTGDASSLPPGTYFWGVSLPADDNNNAVFECGGAEGVENEVLTIEQASPSIATTLSESAGIHGDKVHDSAKLSGETADAGGTVTYSVYSDSSCTTKVADGGTKNVTNGSVPNSNDVTFDTPGTYYWQASYSGDTNNKAALSACTDEKLVIAPVIDLAVTKVGSPNPITIGKGNITWTMVVTNNGPDGATGVHISDPLPAGTTFVSVSTSKGSCTGGAIISCNIGAMAAGETVTITLVTTPTQEGTVTNTVTVVGNEHESNTANNTATASVVVNGFTPPPVFCVAVSKITPKQLFVGRKTTLTIRLTKHNKAAAGYKVRIKGPKVNLVTARSNAKGVIKKTVKLKKAGILIFTPLASKRCNTKRIGVTGVFTPPVTG